jgi:putative ABC transport system permease protein
MATLMQDLKYGARMLLAKPGFTAVAVLTLALGIGATTAIFSVVNTVLLRPLPYAHSDRLVRVYTEFPNFPDGGLRRFWASAPEYLDIKREAKSWDSVDGWVNSGVNLAGQADPVRATASFLTGGLLPSLGVSPLLGRAITPADDDPAAPLTADISYGLWQRAFGGDPHIIGREALLNGRKATIIGVMPKDFHFPPGEVDTPDVWVPIQIDPAKPGSRSSHFLSLLGRLKPGVTITQAQSELDALVQEWGKLDTMNAHYLSPKNHPLVSYPFQEEVVRGVRSALLMLLGAVALVLLIACVNVANLLLVRAEGRQREVAIRSAMGAGIARLVRQFVTEGVILSLLGATLGLALAYGGLHLVKTTAAISIPRATEIGIDPRVLLFTLALSVFTGVFFGMAPLFHLVVSNLHEALKSAGGATTVGAEAKRFRHGLVVVELALALMLLIGTGLMVRAFWKLQEVDAGFDPHHVLTMSVALPGAVYGDNAKVLSFWTRLQDRISSLPGVKAGAIATGLPPLRQLNANDTQIENFVQVKGGPIQNVDFWQIVTKDYFQAAGVRLIEGRLFDERDGPGAPNVAIVNQTMARTFWNHQSPIGRRVRPGFTDPWCTVIGVVADVKNAGLDKPAGTELYLPFNQPQGLGNNRFSILVRSVGDPTSLIGGLRHEVRDLDPALPVANVRTMDEVMTAAQSRPRFLTTLLTLFSSAALILAAVGIYGVIAYSVAQRTKEFGLRMALGAERGDLLKLVVGQGLILVGAGVLLGLGGALSFTRFLSSLLYGVRPTDPITFSVVPLILGAVALLASYLPARRATKVDPMVALRYE